MGSDCELTNKSGCSDQASKKGTSRQEVQLAAAFLEEVGSQNIRQGDEEGDDAVLRTKIEATTQLISEFNSQTAAWETVEVCFRPHGFLTLAFICFQGIFC